MLWLGEHYMLSWLVHLLPDLVLMEVYMAVGMPRLVGMDMDVVLV